MLPVRLRVPLCQGSYVEVLSPSLLECYRFGDGVFTDVRNLNTVGQLSL